MYQTSAESKKVHIYKILPAQNKVYHISIILPQVTAATSRIEGQGYFFIGGVHAVDREIPAADTAARFSCSWVMLLNSGNQCEYRKKKTECEDPLL